MTERPLLGVCSCCGRDTAGVDREVVFRYPDAVLGLDNDARTRVYVEAGKSFAALPGRAFVRALLPVRLTDGHEFHFGVWLEVSEGTGGTIWRAWEEPAYRDLTFDACLANAVPPWGDAILGAPCSAAVRDQEELPFIRSSSAERLARVLSEQWSRAECEDLLSVVWGSAGPQSNTPG